MTLARALVRRGVKTSVARHVAETLAEGRPAHVEVEHHDDDFAAELAPLGVTVAAPRPVRGVDLAEVRRKLGLSQEQFANSVGLEVRTLQNWEQGRAPLEGPTALLVRILQLRPDIAQRAAAGDLPASDREPAAS